MKFPKVDILEQVDTLLKVGIALSSEKDHTQLLEIILSEARKLTNADAGTLYLREGDFLHFKITQNETLNNFQGGKGEPINLPPVPMRMENVSSYVALTNQVVNIPDVYEAEGFDFSGPKKYDAMTGYKTTSMLVIPLENHEREVIGVLQLINARDEEGETCAFAPAHERFISSLASQAAIALTNMQFIEDIEQLFKSFVEVMATAIDSITPYNANHTRRVALLAGELSTYLNDVHEGYWGSQYFSEERTAQLVMAAWLHDVGKIATPLTVMNKATRLEASLDLAMMRFDYIMASENADFMAQKLEAAVSAPDQVPQIDQAWNERKEQIEKARALIIKADHPATFVDKDLVAELESIAACSYTDPKGNIYPWITPDELVCLKVAKGTLTDDERKIMEDHVVVTRRMLDHIPFTRKLRDVPYLAGIHHELLDGKGYPNGLAGPEIPAEGRILALLDVFDALTASDRPYKKALPMEEALKILGFMVKDGKLDGELFELFKESKVWERIDLTLAAS